MCVVAAKHFDDTGWVLAKNRDRNYTPVVRMIQTKAGGVERLYLYDLQTGYSEGINELGIAIISAAVAVKSDEKEGAGKKKSGKSPANGTSPDGRRIRAALLEKTVDKALKSLIDSKIPGNTFVTDGKVCFLLESGYKPDDTERTDYRHEVLRCEKGKTYVRTNHGILLPFLGYSKKNPDQVKKRESSDSRYEAAVKSTKDAGDPLEFLNALGHTPHKNAQMNPIRLAKNEPEDMLTTGQILLIPDHKTLTYRPTLSEVELDNYNKINGVKSETYFEIISNRQLATFKDFVKK